MSASEGAGLSDAVTLTGQVALVTGGGQGLGQVTAQRLGAAGAAVAVTGRTASKLDETIALVSAEGGRAMAFPADVTNPESVEHMVAEVRRLLGPPDLLVNNAAVITPIGVLWKVDPDEWWRTFEINVRGPFLCARAVLPDMLARRRGRIINVASEAVNRTHPHASAYANSKAALVHWTASLGEATEEHGIRIFAVDPGTMTTRTGMQRYMSESDHVHLYYPQVRAIAEEGRGVPPERSADLVVALASGVAVALTGRFFSVHDDLDELVRRADDIRRDDLLTLRIRK